MPQNKLMATEELENHTATGLLDLPVELLLKIIALVPDTSALTLTCKKLYNFVFLCDASKKYKINIRHEDLVSFWKVLTGLRTKLIYFLASGLCNFLSHFDFAKNP